MTELDSDQMAASYHKYVAKKILFIIICIVGVVFVIGYAATIGSADMTAIQVYETIYNHLFNPGNIDPTDDWVVFTVRLPRILTGWSPEPRSEWPARPCRA